MLDVGFFELVLLFVVGLLVLGPERLPVVARSAGEWLGRARGYVRQMSAELDREVRRSELKEQLDKGRQILNGKVDIASEAHGKTPSSSEG